MHHGKHFRRLNRTSSHRQSLLRNLASSLVERGRIETTLAKAKELKPIADNLITLGKKGDVNAKRQALSFLRTRDVTLPKLFDELAPRFANRQGGYTRMQRIGSRYGDNAPMAVIEYIDGPKDLKKEMVAKTLAQITSQPNGPKLSEIFSNETIQTSESITKSLARDISKVRISNSIENIVEAVKKESAAQASV